MYRGPRAFRLRALPAYTFAHSRRAQSRLLQSQEGLRLQPVRFRSPRFTTRRLITFALYSGCTAAYLYYIFPQLLLSVFDVEFEDEAEEEEEQVENAEAEGAVVDEWVESDAIFIPLTWAKKLPRTYYKGSDPEWQDFIMVAKDSKKHKQVHKELVQLLFQGVTAHPAISRQLGKEPQIGKYWFDITFPDGPPQEYSRKGIEVGDGYLAWSAQRITEQQQHRTSHMLWPAATASALYAFCRTLFDFQLQNVKAALGIESKSDPGSREQRMKQMKQMLEAQQASKPSRLSKAQTSPDSGAVGSSTQSADMASSTTGQSKPSSDAIAQERQWYMPNQGLPGEPMEQVIASTMFAHTLGKSMAQPKQEPPRGTFIVAGLIMMKGSRAAITFDVQAFYDPKTSRFVAVNVSPKSMKRWHQPPRGGP